MSPSHTFIVMHCYRRRTWRLVWFSWHCSAVSPSNYLSYFYPPSIYQLHLQHQPSGGKWNKQIRTVGDPCPCSGRCVCVCVLNCLWMWVLSGCITLRFGVYSLISFECDYFLITISSMTVPNLFLYLPEMIYCLIVIQAESEPDWKRKKAFNFSS